MVKKALPKKISRAHEKIYGIAVCKYLLKSRKDTTEKEGIYNSKVRFKKLVYLNTIHFIGTIVEFSLLLFYFKLVSK